MKTQTIAKRDDDALTEDLPNQLKLIRLTIKNFKGCREITIEPDGRDIAIFGDNASGKTTISDAFYWLLFGKDSRGAANFAIKTLNESGEPIHNLNHSVEAELVLPDGKSVKLRRTYREVYEKRRGAATAEFAQHTTDYFVNDVPCGTEREYMDWIAQICDEKRFRLLCDPLAFNEKIHWQERRKILLDVCGDVSDADVIAATPKLADLPDILGQHSLDDYRKIITARRREINEQLNTLPAIISALSESLPDPTESIPDDAPLRAELANLQEQRARITAGGEVAEQTKRLREIEGEIIALENELRQSSNAEKLAAEERVAAKRREYTEAQAEVDRILSAIKSAEASRDASLQRLNSLRSEGNELLALAFEFSGLDTCAACGQSLPTDRVAEARRKAEEEFNANKSRRLEANIAEGKAIRAQYDEHERQIGELEQALEQARERAEALRLEGVELKKIADSIETSAADLPANPKYTGLCESRTALVTEIEKLKTHNYEALAALDSQITNCQEHLAEIADAKARVEVRNENLARIAKLEQTERDLAAEMERIEHHLYLCEEFIRTKVSMLTDRINARFRLASFKLFEQQINGGIAECCETTYGGVPFSSLNHGARLNVGLDIINTLSEHDQFAPPIFIDNAESVTSIIDTNGQQIKLIVSANDKKLRIESNETMHQQQA